MGKRLALTFDVEHPDRAHHDPEGSDAIVAVLERAGIRATFFIQGRWATAHPDQARRIATAGHLVGHHSHFHAPMSLLHDDGIHADVREAAECIADATGRHPRPWFRCPFGDGHDDPRVLQVLSEAGYVNVHWDVDSYDWKEAETASGMAARALGGIEERGDGAVVLFHSWPAVTPRALSSIIRELTSQGATFVTVDEIMQM
jgi:peptidoglycan/xylan/chitin deacetylase (PgdA/CDA1 family)